MLVSWIFPLSFRSISNTGILLTFLSKGELHEKGTNITLMIQADMLAYHSPLEPPQLGLPDL